MSRPGRLLRAQMLGKTQPVDTAWVKAGPLAHERVLARLGAVTPENAREWLAALEVETAKAYAELRGPS